MKKTIKHIFTVILAALIVLTSIPVISLSDLDLGINLTAFAADIATEGKCGDNVKWSYNAKTKTLTISGKGAMYDYDIYNGERLPYRQRVFYEIENVIVKKGITHIGNGAFNDKNIKKVTLPKGLLTIGSDAFMSTSITAITLPNTLKSIGEAAFDGCEMLKKVNIPNSVKFIDSFAFSYSGIAEIDLGDGVEILADYALEGCNNLTKVRIGKSLKTFSADVILTYEGKVTSVTVDSDNKYFSSDKYGVVYNKNKTELIYFPVNRSLTDFKVPSTVKKINRYAFYHVSNLKNVNTNKVTEIEEYAFCYSGISTIKFGTSLKKIGDGAFSSCEKLMAVTIPKNVEFLGEYNFENLTFTVDENNKNYCSDKNGVLFDKKKETLISYPKKLKNKSYKVPNTVKTICEEAFSGNEYLESVTIPKSVTKIEDGAFMCCTSLSSITFPNTAVYVGYNAFYDTAWLNALRDDWKNAPIYLGKVFMGYSDEYNLPSTVEIKEGTLSIAEDALSGGYDVKKVVIPESVEIIGEDVFSYCESITTIDFSGNEYFTLDDGRVLYNKDKSRIVVCALKKLKTSYTIPSSVKEIDEGAFNSATNLKTINFEEGVSGIDLEDFNNTAWYSKLEKDSIIYINDTALGYITDNYGSNPVFIIKDGTKVIAEEAMGYEYFEAMVIPESVTEINCYLTKEVYYKGTEEQWNNIVKNYVIGEVPESTIYYSCNFSDENHVHKYYGKTVKYAECLTAGEKVYACPCGDSYFEKTTALGHTGAYVAVTVATFSKNGKQKEICEWCGKDLKYSAPIYKIASVELASNNLVYNGKVRQPEIIAKDSQGNVITDYYYYYDIKESKKIGNYTAKIYFDDMFYSGTKTLKYSIVPGKTSKLTAKQGNKAVTLSWNAVKGATGYRVYKYNSATKKYEKVADTEKLTYKVKNLKSTEGVKFAVKAYTKSGKSYIWANTYKTITTAKAPAAVTLKAQASGKSVKLTWNKSENADGYRVYFKKSSDTKWTTVKASTTALSYTVNNLAENQKYDFAVRPYVKEGKILLGKYKMQKIST